MNAGKIRQLKCFASEIREQTVELIYQGRGGHIGGDLSEVEILVAVYDLMRHDPANPDWKDRDYFILSKGHSAETYYVLLGRLGYIAKKDLRAYGTFHAMLGGHPTNNIPGVEANTGSLGHGLGLAVGKALIIKKDKKTNRVYVLTGDGELEEGSVWEAAMAAAKFGLDNLTWIIDRNGRQISGTTEEVMPLEKLKAKAEAFGFNVQEVNGHEVGEIREALGKQSVGKPNCLIAHTVKGKGLQQAEEEGWHHKMPSWEQVEEVRKQEAKIREELRNK